MSMLKSVTKTSNYRSNIHGRYKLNGEVIKPVSALENSTVSHYSRIDLFPKNQYHRLNSSLFNTLDNEREQANKLLHEKIKDLERYIKDVISAYNHIVGIIVEIEAEEENQIDHEIQNFLILNHQAFSALGINIRQSLYLEYDTIMLRSAIRALTPEEIIFRLFSNKGLLVMLFRVVDQVVYSLRSEPESTLYPGSVFDVKA
ncbi:MULTISPECIES: hypothetical protein [unclassified Fusibacter]|uniref:hypothetical protein n=1 Tax=unclassified Fusibacter TaxID=2624464 RepID=UPI0010113F5E|nr:MULTISPECIES: hypothetical protein [unclassified Fusibacter]MCK8058259.1 hypothetical protein [Fusibacter sp. A2]NPE20842.1 hypothetical protein [Fusibacter sp. A1]RXV63047.1 hypothetical protein DWB64_03340 [Fusibacter sp. A1]